MNENEYCIGEILPWVRKILSGTETTIPRECLQDYKRLSEELSKFHPVKHGHWKMKQSPIMPEVDECDQCGFSIVYGHGYKYCPMCGAMMDEVSE